MVKLPIQQAISAIIAFGGITITRVQSHMEKQTYDGTVTFNARSGGVEFTYVYQFSGVSDVKSAISIGVTCLRRDLGHLSSAAQEVHYDP
jgi:hypothetical protein